MTRLITILVAAALVAWIAFSTHLATTHTAWIGVLVAVVVGLILWRWPQAPLAGKPALYICAAALIIAWLAASQNWVTWIHTSATASVIAALAVLFADVRLSRILGGKRAPAR
jgi:hypothetical protein